jgi:hypothetical protein
MRQIRDVLRLKFKAGLSNRTLTAALGISKEAALQHPEATVLAGL